MEGGGGTLSSWASLPLPSGLSLLSLAHGGTFAKSDESGLIYTGTLATVIQLQLCSVDTTYADQRGSPVSVGNPPS